MEMLSPLAGSSAAWAPAPASATVHVVGSGMMMVAPTAATVTIGVRSIQPTAQAAQGAVSTSLGNIARAIQALGVPVQSLQTSSVILAPETTTDPTTHEVRTVGFRAEQTLTATTENLGLVGPIIDAAVSNGANVIQGVSFSVRNPEAVQLLAIALASQNAQMRAMVLARQFGLVLTAVRRVSTSAALPPVPIRIGLPFAAAAPTPIFPGQETITATVEVEYTAAPGPR